MGSKELGQGGLGRRSWSQGGIKGVVVEGGSRIVTLTPHRFPSCRLLLHFTRFASNRLCIKSSSHQVVTYPSCHIIAASRHKLSCTQHTSPHPLQLYTHFCHTPTHFSTPPLTLHHKYPLLPQTPILLKNCPFLIVQLHLWLLLCCTEL